MLRPTGANPERFALWQRKRAEIEGVTDALGLGLDEHIKDTVVAVQVNGFSTAQSCEGHVDWGCGAPWIDVQASGQPGKLFPEVPDSLFFLNKYNGHEAAFAQVAAEAGISLADLLSRKNYQQNQALIAKAQELASETGESPQYSAWKERNQQLLSQMRGIASEYHTVRQVPPQEQVQFALFGDGSFRMFTGPKSDLERNVRTQTEAEKQALADRLPHSRLAMENFGQYLTERFFTQGPVVS